MEEILKKLFGLFSKCVYLKDRVLYVFLTVYVLYTYVFEIFDQTPYIGIFGPYDSGKTRLGSLLEGLCFNATFTGSITSSALFRYVDQEPGTIIIDEGLHNQSRFDTLNRILRTGYRRNGRVICTEPDHSLPKFSTFCPKVIIDNAEPSDIALSSRIIAIHTVQSPRRLKRFLDSEAQVKFTEARNLIKTFWEENRQALSEHYSHHQGSMNSQIAMRSFGRPFSPSPNSWILCWQSPSSLKECSAWPIS